MVKRGVGLAIGAMLLLGCGLGGEDSGGTDSAAYPTEEIRILVPFDAGGPTDLAARALAPVLEEELGQNVVVENRSGAGGANAYNAMLSGEPDGHSLGMLSLPFAVISSIQADIGYTADDFAPIGVAIRAPNVIVTPADSRFESAEDLFSAATASPGDIEIGTTGATVSSHVEMERLANEYDVPVTPVPFDGSSPLTAALLGSQVDAGVLDATPEILELIESGKVRALAVTSPERAPVLPDVPTLAELGYETLTAAVSVTGLTGPAGMPDDVLERLEDAMEKAMSDPEVREVIGEPNIPEEFIGSEDLERIVSELQDVYSKALG